MKRTVQALGIVGMAVASWAIGVVTGMIMMAAGEHPATAAPPQRPKWERSL